MLKTPAITLKSRKWGEADRIVTFYTVRFGKLRGVARGARRMKSRFGSALEPFVHCDLNLFEKHNDPLYRITQADIRETFPRLREDLAAMSGAARMVNLVDHAGGPGHRGEVFPKPREGFPDVRLGDAIQRIVVFLEQIEVAVDERLQGTAEAAFHPSRPARNPAQLAEPDGIERDDPVGLPPLAALERDSGCLQHVTSLSLHTNESTSRKARANSGTSV